MEYIVLDLEWDSMFYKAEKRFINHIVQIGAVKLNQNFEIIDSFDSIVCAAISNRVSGRFSSLTGISSEKMRAGIPLEAAVRSYNLWAGNDIITMTWSNSDLFAIYENEYLLPKNIRFHIGYYVDIQKYIQNELALMGYTNKNQISLFHAAELLEISTDEFSLHTARDDSMVCVAMLKKAYNACRFNALIRDTSDPDFYKRLFFKSYYINDINDPLIDKAQFKLKCPKCGTRLVKSSRWNYRNRNFNAKLFCMHCRQRYKAQLSFRKTYDDIIVKRKLFLPQEENTREMQSLPPALQQ